MKSKLLKVLPFVVLSIIFACTGTQADESDDTLEYYLSKSQVVVHGKIFTEPRVNKYKEKKGATSHEFDFQVIDVIKGDFTKKNDILMVNVLQFVDNPTDQHPLINKDKTSILFLKDSGYRQMLLETVDHWFAVQYPNPNLLKSLKRLMINKEADAYIE